MHDLTARLARHAIEYRTAALDTSTLTVAKQCVLDWFGVTLAGMDEPVARILRSEIAPGSRGMSSIIGHDMRCAPADAALINGATSHALDYDDVHPLVGHPTAAILPAALALGEAESCSGDDVLRAFVAGYEVAAFVGSLVMPSHYDRGFHSTATLGAFGAAAAAGVLMKLNETQMAVALGLAGTQAAGLKSMFGTMAKPFHAGKAASNGIIAARLAARGFSANPAVLDVAQGFVTTQCDGRPEKDVRPLPLGSVVVTTRFKYHAACYLTHSTIEAVAALRRELKLSGPDIASIDVHVPIGHLSVCNIPAPRNGLETKFSLRHTAALAACGTDTASVTSYSDRYAVDPSLAEVRERVTVYGDRPPGQDARVIMTSRSGRSAELTCDVGLPDSDLTRQGKRLADKFTTLASAVVGADRADKLRNNIATLNAQHRINLLTTV
ncbi:MmgE/PrpD family protein [Bradyrhizobium sp. B097]|uniref:MmgE/PrpD family protein n=1 Tax=Bradyrhizobium sp. B097 TaxID=3140244 RepID=UPI00318405EA